MRIRYTKEAIEAAVKESFSWAQVTRKLGLQPHTGSQSHIARRAKFFGVDHSHFTGQAWNRGKTYKKRAVQEYLHKGSTIQSSTLRIKLIKEGVKEAKCEHCGLVDWLGKPAPLELDHINSDHWDNRLENLAILCPNCHAVKTAKRCKAHLVER